MLSLVETCLLSSAETRRRGTDSPVSATTSSYNTLVHSSLYTVVHLEVKLGKLIGLVSRSFLNITKGGGIYDVTDNETLDSLILGDGLSSRNASIITNKKVGEISNET